MAKKMKKLSSLILALSLVMSLMSVSAFAEGTEYKCGMGEHTHGDTCYTQQLDSTKCTKHECVAECAVPCAATLVCTKEVHAHEGACAHTHSNACCAIVEEGHEHSEACYDACGKEYDCGKEAYAHTDACYEAHTHGDACYKTVLTCTAAVHTHSSGCAYGLGVVAIIGDNTYTSLKAAVEAANAAEGADTIVLVDDATFDAAISVTESVTVSGAYTLTRADSYTGTLFNVAEGATLTLTAITVDGGNEWTFKRSEFMSYFNSATKCPANAYYAVSEAGAPVATAPMFVVNGSVILGNGATVHVC